MEMKATKTEEGISITCTAHFPDVPVQWEEMPFHNGIRKRVTALYCTTCKKKEPVEWEYNE